MANECFTKWREELLRSGVIAPLRIGASQEEVAATFGPPERTSLQKKKGRFVIFKYADIEFHFDAQKEHRLWLVYSESEDGEARIRVT